MDHRPLCLSPDIVWLMICQGVANHINANTEELRSRLVTHEGKIQISVRRDDFVKGSPENPWAEAIEELTNQVRAHIGSAFDLFQPTFTTTGPVEKASAGVVLLDAMQCYFDYDMETFCGIPAITLEGTPEDWQAVADRAEHFGSLDLEWWLQPLRGILRQFVAAAQGEIDRPFWQSLYKYHDESGGPMITGWISALLPYLKDGRTGLTTNRNPWLTPESQRVEDIDGEIDEEIDDIEIDEEIDDIEIDEEDGKDFDEFDEASERPPAKQPLNRLILKRNQNVEKSPRSDQTLKDVMEAEQPPRRFIPTAQQDMEDSLRTGPDEDMGASDEDLGDNEYVVGAWLRPTPRRKQNGGNDDLGFGWGPRIFDLPVGLSKAPFCWHFLKQDFDMEFLGGFVGVSQDKETLAVKPEIGWAVREAPTN
jgi:hypothetical protein